MSDLVERLRYEGGLYHTHPNPARLACIGALDRIEALESALLTRIRQDVYCDRVQACEQGAVKDCLCRKEFDASLNRSHGDDNG